MAPPSSVVFKDRKTAAKTISAAEIFSEAGLKLTLRRLDKAYAIDKMNTLDADIADFLDYSWKKELNVRHFISGFHRIFNFLVFSIFGLQTLVSSGKALLL